jgi:sigma-B regulation protein RsbU (phosphoserine phosphatase)
VKETRVLTFAILAYLVALFNNTVSPEWRFFDGNFELGGMSAALTNLLQLLFATAMMILLLRRLAADRQEKQRLAAELEAARVVQQLLLSQASVDSGVYEVETVYSPAQHVGGDFFWVRTDADGALLVMVGDVSGKGMKAAMLVTLIMGVLRQRAERQPEELLALVNRAVAGEMHGGFVTACCMRADPDGTVTIANAGHLLPYRQGREIDIPSGLPLGVAEEVNYASSPMSLEPGEQLTFISDGVVEAASGSGELLGFDRTRSLSVRPAQEIAEAAKAWGQNDDITVVTVRRRK